MLTEADGEQEGPTSGLTCRPRRPPSRHRWPLEEENSGGRRMWEHVYNAVAGFNVFPVKRPLSSLPVTNVRSALRGFHVLPPSLLPQALLVYLVSHMGRKRNQVQRVDKITQLQDVAETRIPLSKHTMMPNPFPEMSEVNGGQKVPEPRSDLSKNTSLVGVGGNSSRGGC